MTKAPKEIKHEVTLDELLNVYNSTAKKNKLEIFEVQPNHCLCMLKRLHKPLANAEGKTLILPGDIQGEDELVFQVVKVGVCNNENYFEPKKDDLIIVRDATPIRFLPSTKYIVDGIEYPVFHIVSTANILFKVGYTKEG